MVGFSSQTESWVSIRKSIYQSQEEETTKTTAESFRQKGEDWTNVDQEEEEEDNNHNQDKIRKKKKKNQVLLEGYVEALDEEDELKRTKSLTDDDLDELKGCLDLGFGFSYEEIPELCNTLPALELCYSMSQKYLDDQHHKSSDRSPDTTAEPVSSPVANWKISSPGVLPVGMNFPAIVGNGHANTDQLQGVGEEERDDKDVSVVRASSRAFATICGPLHLLR